MGMLLSYQPRQSSLLSPPTRRIACRFLSNANSADFGAAGRSRPKFLHFAVAATHDRVDKWSTQRRTFVTYDAKRREQCFGISLFERISPCRERWMELDIPRASRHADNGNVIKSRRQPHALSGVQSRPLVGDIRSSSPMCRRTWSEGPS
jgi:hypothetical protein